MNNEDQKAKAEALLQNAIGFLQNAILRGDQQAGEILQALQDLDQEQEIIKVKVATINSLPRHTHAENVNFYLVTIPAMDRLIEIQNEKQCIALEVAGSNYKIVASLLKQIKRRKIKQNFLNN